jgi:anti-sigma factor ChrR (cupin superfamily)
MSRSKATPWREPDAEELALAAFDVAASDEAPPPAGLWAKIDARLAAEASAGDLKAERFDDGRWRSYAPGIRYKRLWSSRTLLLDCEPGAVIPDHDHPQFEHAIVLSGDLVSELGVFHAGDYHGVPQGGRHQPWTTRTGCRILIQYAA